jgi:hypothetical protein
MEKRRGHIKKATERKFKPKESSFHYCSKKWFPREVNSGLLS